jgi:putative transcriptional regulator
VNRGKNAHEIPGGSGWRVRHENKDPGISGTKKLTQEDLARLAGVRRETILSIENGRHVPSLLLAHAVARALGTSIDELFFFDE